MSYKIIGKYIREVKFNIPNSKTFFLLSKNIAKYKINIDIKSNQIKQNIIEVLTSINLTPNSDEFEKIDTKIIFATIIEIKNEKVQKKEIEKIILIDVPTKIYSELRDIFINLGDSVNCQLVELFLDTEYGYKTFSPISYSPLNY